MFNKIRFNVVIAHKLLSLLSQTIIVIIVATALLVIILTQIRQVGSSPAIRREKVTGLALSPIEEAERFTDKWYQARKAVFERMSEKLLVKKTERSKDRNRSATIQSDDHHLMLAPLEEAHRFTGEWYQWMKTASSNRGFD